MADEFVAITDGTFVLEESEVKDQFFFYRKDGEVLGDVGREPMEFYHSYILKKMMSGEITEPIIKNIRYETSQDGKCIRLTACGIDEDPSVSHDSDATKKRPNIFKRLIKRILG